MIDPYRDWLKIPEDRRPPNHYQLLDVPSDADFELIKSGAASRLAAVRRYQVGRFAEDAQRLINEIAAAYGVLSDPIRRREYDDQLAGVTTTPSPPRISPTVDDDQLPPLQVESTWTPSDEPEFPNPLRPTDEQPAWPSLRAIAALGFGIALAIAVATIVAAMNRY